MEAKRTVTQLERERRNMPDAIGPQGNTDEDMAAKPAPAVRRRRRVLWLALVIMCGLIAAPVVMLIGAEYYTSRSEFCGSCHIMDPYYKSWQAS